jgi:hypothetical protein
VRGLWRLFWVDGRLRLGDARGGNFEVRLRIDVWNLRLRCNVGGLREFEVK